MEISVTRFELNIKHTNMKLQKQLATVFTRNGRLSNTYTGLAIQGNRNLGRPMKIWSNNL
jgi:hypothetical protein